MSEYTPTTEQVRRSFERQVLGGGASPLSQRIAGEAFDRWLAAHDAEARADEREKAAQRVLDAWEVGALLVCEHPDHMLASTAVAAARGGDKE